ncbi:sialidase family protein [Pareuzebyella sediminis]|uniref:sialidase family protein n=1 Tax=Pareuzebyella sediminis TaxID=2607998 RepID=UPI0011ED6FD0|nr:sialidase family protein [Pareuzebyella sediminis]
MKSLFLLLTVLFSFGLFGQEKLVLQNLFDATLSEEVSCYRIPALTTAPNGDLLAAIDERVASCSDLGTNPNINIVLRRSTDHGKTWSEIEKVADFPEGQSASDPSFIVDMQTKNILLFYNYMNVNEEKGVYYFHVMKSNDNGKSWSAPQDITSQISEKDWSRDFKFITSGRGIQRRSGQLLHTLVNLEHGLHLFGSDDHGKTFFVRDKPLLPGDESKVVERADGSLMVNSRVNSGGMRYAHFSGKNEATWHAEPQPELIDPSCNASMIRYTEKADGFSKNRILFSNAKNNRERKNMTVRISYDEGQSWGEGKTIYQGLAAYSTMTILENGNIGLLFEGDGYTKNYFTQFSLEWLTDGKDRLNKHSKKKY